MPATPVNMVGVPAPLHAALLAEKERTGTPMVRLLVSAWNAYVLQDSARTAIK